MAVPVRLTMEAAAFEAVASAPENSEKRLELISGEIVDVPSNPFVSKIAGLILTALNVFLREHDLGHVTGADGGYIVNGDVYAPDVAYIAYTRQPELAEKGFNPNPPDLAVEVISDPFNSQEQAALRRKIVNYLAAGTVVWVVDAFAQTVEVYDGVQPVKVCGIGDVLSGGGWLPGFTLAVSAIFPQKRA